MAINRRESAVTSLRGVLALLEAGAIADIAWAAVPADGGDTLGDFMVGPKHPEKLIAQLSEVSAWVGNRDAHAAMAEVVED